MYFIYLLHYLFTCLPVYILTYLIRYLFFCLCVYVFTWLRVYVFTCLLLYMLTWLMCTCLLFNLFKCHICSNKPLLIVIFRLGLHERNISHISEVWKHVCFNNNILISSLIICSLVKGCTTITLNSCQAQFQFPCTVPVKLIPDKISHTLRVIYKISKDLST